MEGTVPVTDASTSRVQFHRYDATVREVSHWVQPPDKRQDVERVIADLDFATGAIWWLEDEGVVQPGDRYTVTVEHRGGPRVA